MLEKDPICDRIGHCLRRREEIDDKEYLERIKGLKKYFEENFSTKAIKNEKSFFSKHISEIRKKISADEFQIPDSNIKLITDMRISIKNCYYSVNELEFEIRLLTECYNNEKVHEIIMRINKIQINKSCTPNFGQIIRYFFKLRNIIQHGNLFFILNSFPEKKMIEIHQKIIELNSVLIEIIELRDIFLIELLSFSPNYRDTIKNPIKTQ
ncbi:MAG: hypothetical protein ACRCUP_07195 [Mycoplasmatales bacterium]